MAAERLGRQQRAQLRTSARSMLSEQNPSAGSTLRRKAARKAVRESRRSRGA